MLRTALALALVATPVLAEEAEHKAEADGVVILHAWTAATDEDHARVYMEIANGNAADIMLLGGSSEVASVIEVHGKAIDGTDKSTAIGAFPIKAGTEFDLDPDGVFLHLDGIKGPLVEGEHFDIVVSFDPIGEIEVEVEIEDEDAAGHSHAGHNH